MPQKDFSAFEHADDVARESRRREHNLQLKIDALEIRLLTLEEFVLTLAEAIRTDDETTHYVVTELARIVRTDI